MVTLCIVPCGKSKIWDKNPQAGPSAAKVVYIGSYAQKCQDYAETFHPEDWYILSAKHGFLAPNDIVPERYNVTFNDKRTNPINVNELMRQAEKKGLLSCDKVVVLGGKRYRNMVEKVFAGKEIVAPLAGCSGIGVIMQRLNYLTAEKKQP